MKHVQKNGTLKVGILKHTSVGIVEKRIMDTLNGRGYKTSIINPLKNTSSLPDMIIGRCEVSSSQDRAFTSYLQYYDRCQRAHIPILNSKKFFLTGQQKYNTHKTIHQFLQQRHIHDNINPPTVYTRNKTTAWRVCNREITDYGSIVIKHPYSSRGQGVFLITNQQELISALQWPYLKNEGIVIQRTIKKEKNIHGGYQDVRLIVCRDATTNKPTVINAYFRNAPRGQFLTNVRQGGYVTPLKRINKQLRTAAMYIMDAVNGDIAGIDMVRDTVGRWWFEEVNVAFEISKTTERLVNKNLWEYIADLVETKLKVS